MPRLNWINYNTILFQALPMVDNIIQGKKKKEVNLPLSGSILSSKRTSERTSTRVCNSGGGIIWF